MHIHTCTYSVCTIYIVCTYIWMGIFTYIRTYVCLSTHLTMYCTVRDIHSFETEQLVAEAPRDVYASEDLVSTEVEGRFLGPYVCPASYTFLSTWEPNTTLKSSAIGVPIRSDDKLCFQWTSWTMHSVRLCWHISVWMWMWLQINLHEMYLLQQTSILLWQGFICVGSKRFFYTPIILQTVPIQLKSMYTYDCISMCSAYHPTTHMLRSLHVHGIDATT